MHQCALEFILMRNIFIAQYLSKNTFALFGNPEENLRSRAFAGLSYILGQSL